MPPSKAAPRLNPRGPRNLPQITTLDKSADYAKFVLEPLERGYGQTIGNALRRVLLSSIIGAGVAAIRIDKVFHEFAPIPGVKEDTTQLMLNLKDLAIRLDNIQEFDEAVLKLEVKGPGRVTGADIQCPEGVSIVNPEVYIATISDAKATLSMELYVNADTGYTLPEKQERYRGTIGLLTMGTQYTPVRKVNYTVESTRVGTRTDYERLLDIWTNGSVSPNDALAQSSHILDKYFRMFFELGAVGFDPSIETTEIDTDELLKNVPDLKIEEMSFTQRTFNCLRRAGILNLRALALSSEGDLSAIRGFGKKSLVEVREKLEEHGLELKP
ncbi:MAG: DNA-directed RNA polymerase subunit alpha, partial [Armatimonadota bacterium]